MKLICKKDALNEEGEKIFGFTKGKEYEAEEIGEGLYLITDDNGDTEQFFNLDIMFNPK